jgi:hypothetical protein
MMELLCGEGARCSSAIRATIVVDTGQTLPEFHGRFHLSYSSRFREAQKKRPGDPGAFRSAANLVETQ